MFEVDSNDSGHIEQFESFLFVGFNAIIFEDIGVNIINDFGSSNQNIDIPLHPQGQGIELEIDWILVIIKPNVVNMRPFEHHVIPVDLFQILTEDKDLRVDETEANRYIQADGHDDSLTNRVKMRNHLVCFRLLRSSLHSSLWWLVVNLYSFLHMLFLKAHQLLTLLHTGHFIADSVIETKHKLFE